MAQAEREGQGESDYRVVKIAAPSIPGVRQSAIFIVMLSDYSALNFVARLADNAYPM